MLILKSKKKDKHGKIEIKNKIKYTNKEIKKRLKDWQYVNTS